MTQRTTGGALVLLVLGMLVVRPASLVAVTKWKGIEPGKSTRADVERQLGTPARSITARLLVYSGQSGLGRIVVEYRDNAVADRIEVGLLDSIPRTAAMEAFNLGSIRAVKKPQPDGKAAEYFGGDASVVLFYEGKDETSGVGRVGFYSRELFDRVTGAGTNDTSDRGEGGTGGSGSSFPPPPPQAPPPPSVAPPATALDPAACLDVYYWARNQQEVARRSNNAARRQQLFDIQIASQRGDCDRARKQAAAYRALYGR